MERLSIITGNCLVELPKLEAGSVQMVCTSPPYWNLRDYQTASWVGGDEACDHRTSAKGNKQFGNPEFNLNRPSREQTLTADAFFTETCGKCGAVRVDEQIGLEKLHDCLAWARAEAPCHACYVCSLRRVFKELWRVLRDDGTVWLNLGDSYIGYKGDNYLRDKSNSNLQKKSKVPDCHMHGTPQTSGLRAKNLCMIPARVALALQADGWTLRSEIIWHKPNPMPESVTDRPTKAHEQVYLLSKSASYFYDAEAISESAVQSTGGWQSRARAGLLTLGPRSLENSDRNDGGACTGPNRAGSSRNRRSVWTINTRPEPSAHFAVMPEELVRLCILAGTSEAGCCAKCGQPRERVVERVGETPRQKQAREGASGYVAAQPKNGQGLDYKGGHGSNIRPAVTKGWKSGCACNAETVPCLVLDPFGGSGTVGRMALKLNRRAVLIDLNPAYSELQDARCTVTYGLPFMGAHG